MSVNILKSFNSLFKSRNLDLVNFSKITRLASTYNAAILKESGASLVIEPQKPKKLTKEQVRVRVDYCSVNSFDVQKFKCTDLSTLPLVPGYEFSGEILETGEDVNKVEAQIGDRVAVWSRNFGGFAEQAVVDVNDIWRIPSKVKSRAAAVILHGHTNALYTFSHLTSINEKSKIVISAGPAGLGLAAIDVVSNVFKIKPFGICDTESRGELVRERGAFKTGYFKSKDLKKDLGLKDGAEIVYDAVGGEIHPLLAKCVSQEGHIFYAAPEISLSKIVPPINAKFTLVNVEALRLTNLPYFRQLVSDTLDLADQSLISAHISKTFRLAHVNEAIKFIEDRKCTGKVVIDMNEDDDDDDKDDD